MGSDKGDTPVFRLPMLLFRYLTRRTAGLPCRKKPECPLYLLRRYLFSALTLAILFQSCTTVSQAPPLSVQEDPDRFIRIEGRYGDEHRVGPTRFEHPLILTTEEWERILSNIQVQSRKDTLIATTAKNPAEPALSPDQLVYLSQGLQKAFSRAHPDEFVVFGFSQTRSPQLTEITTGGWFVEGQRLHLILANYRHSVSMKTIRDELWRDPLHSNSSPSYQIVPGPNQTLGREKGLAGFLSTDAPDLLIDYKALLEMKPSAPAALSPVGSPIAVPAPAAAGRALARGALASAQKAARTGIDHRRRIPRQKETTTGSLLTLLPVILFEFNVFVFLPC